MSLPFIGWLENLLNNELIEEHTQANINSIVEDDDDYKPVPKKYNNTNKQINEKQVDKKTVIDILLNKDMKLPNNCQELKNIKTKVKTIDFNGKTYYYKSENKNIDIFEFNENLF